MHWIPAPADAKVFELKNILGAKDKSVRTSIESFQERNGNGGILVGNTGEITTCCRAHGVFEVQTRAVLGSDEISGDPVSARGQWRRVLW